MRRIFINPAGQRDNLGDSVLRRPYLDALRARGTLHVLAGRDDDYSSGLGIGRDDVIYRSPVAWLGSAFLHAVGRRLTFAVNAGEVVGTRAEKRRSIWQPILAALARFSGGEVIIAGVSVRPGTKTVETHLSYMSRMAALVTWRDAATMEESGRGVVQPDWAFHLGGTGSGGPRDRFVVCLRGDRPAPTEEVVRSIRDYARLNELELWVVVQVRRDADAARTLAGRLGASVFEWPSHINHADHERALRDFYKGSRIVASDRIHALIIATTEGAVPIGITTSDPAKLSRTFSHVMPLAIINEDSVVGDADPWVRAVSSEEEIRERLTQARNTLDQICCQISTLRNGRWLE